MTALRTRLGAAVVAAGFAILVAAFAGGAAKAEETAAHDGVPAPSNAVPPANSKTESSATFIYTYIVKRLAFLEECAQADKPYAGSYSGAWESYSKEATPVADRAYGILREEFSRAGRSADNFADAMFEIGRGVRSQFMDMAEKDETAFALGCRGVPRMIRDHSYGFKPLEQLFPDQMRDVNEWR